MTQKNILLHSEASHDKGQGLLNAVGWCAVRGGVTVGGDEMSEKFTKGPWTVGHAFSYGDDAALAVLNADGDEICNFGNTLLDEEAHANIIAAAPEMYSLLENALVFIEKRGSGPVAEILTRAINETLKKARGES